MISALRIGVAALALAACSGDPPRDAGAGGGGGDATATAQSSASTGAGGAGGTIVHGENPVLAGDHPDPHVLRTVGADGRAVYWLVATIGDGGDIPIWTSTDLVHWSALPDGAFHRPKPPGGSLDVHDGSFCAIWAPEIVEIGPASYMLHFTAQRFAVPQAACPGYDGDSGVYLAWAPSPAGPFADDQHPWEPLPAGAQIATCPKDIRDAIPHSLDFAAKNCQGGYCDNVVRLDSDVFRDPLTGRWWLAYAWYTNRPPMVAWENDNHGEHVSLVELDASDPFAVRCDPSVAKVFAANPHDAATLDRLATSCDRCAEMLSFTKGRNDEELVFDGYSWGVNEGPSLFRRGDWVYLLASGSAWDSAYYSVFWIAAHSVEELAYDNPARLAGRVLVPSLEQSFGHGSAVLGPDGKTLYFVHHRLRHADCKATGDCARDVWVSRLDFEDHGDGLGDVWIAPRFPAEDPGVDVALP